MRRPAGEHVVNLTEAASDAPRPLKAASAPDYPAADDAAPALGGFAFSRAAPPHAPGVFALTLAVAGRAYPVVIGEGEDLALALAAAEAALPPLPGAVGRLWMERGPARQRGHIVSDLVRKLNPPLNVEGRSARAPAEIAALAPDAAADAFPPAVEDEGAAVSEEALDRLVRSFYAAAREDPLIGPVFAGAVADWEHHYGVVHDFWSRTLLGTSRYQRLPVHRAHSAEGRTRAFRPLARHLSRRRGGHPAARGGAPRDPQGRAHERVLPGGAHAGGGEGVALGGAGAAGGVRFMVAEVL